jgi:hypothetical protein
MINCQGCGAVNEDQATACAACGRILAVICPQCSTRTPSGINYCQHCGRILTTEGGPQVEAAVAGDPILDMYTPALAELGNSEMPPRAAFLKVVCGGFAFAFLYLSQALSGTLSPPFFPGFSAASSRSGVWSKSSCGWRFASTNRPGCPGRSTTSLFPKASIAVSKQLASPSRNRNGRSPEPPRWRPPFPRRPPSLSEKRKNAGFRPPMSWWPRWSPARSKKAGTPPQPRVNHRSNPAPHPRPPPHQPPRRRPRIKKQTPPSPSPAMTIWTNSSPATENPRRWPNSSMTASSRKLRSSARRLPVLQAISLC